MVTGILDPDRTWTLWELGPLKQLLLYLMVNGSYRR
jgi:hypothetical protein